MIHTFKNIRFYFGDASTQVDGKTLVESYEQAIQSRTQIQSVASHFGATDLFFLHQVHASHGQIIDEASIKSFKPFAHEGDFLITACKNVVIGVLTADCASVLIYDPKRSAVAAVHAGWKGAVNNVVSNACREMQNVFGSDYEDLHIWIGPSAHACCYEVSADFVNHIPVDYVHHISLRDNQNYFDLVGCVEQQLVELSINKSHIDTHHALCTLHNNHFCSSRRSNRSPMRQMSVIMIGC